MKRVRNRLRKLNSTHGLGGKGKLTNKFIDKLQNYYGIAKRRNVGELKTMKQAISGALFHWSSNPDPPMHNECLPE
ncbi:hypothetical protein CEXT_710331 [Caerostris extrusa]|uniref:Uncharacterized protein n=1 Tax=Caerostris extrusa TaxID=172846 RepID=A0AAV4S5L6_CAEEX|nr:hypothetical protein CEXT_710331 [Caerostris extrusa]